MRSLPHRQIGAGGWALPLACLSIRFIPTALILTYTRKDSPLRQRCAFFVLVISCWQCMTMILVPGAAARDNLFYTDVIVMILDFVNLLAVARVEKINGLSSKPTQSPYTLGTELRNTLRLMVSTRAIGTKWQVKNVPCWPRYYCATPPNNNKSRFLVRQTVIASWQGIAFLYTFVLWRKHSHNLHEGLFLSSHLPQVVQQLHSSHVNRLDTLQRLAATFQQRRGRVDAPSLLGPLLAPVSTVAIQCTGDRSALATVVTRRVLRLPRPSLVERYAHMLCVFALSAIFHILSDIAQGVDWRQSGALPFFTSFPVGIMIEDRAQAAWRWATIASRGSMQRHGEDTKPCWQKAVGYVWVVSWFVVLTPHYLGKTYELWNTPGEGAQMPFLGDITQSVVIPLSIIIGAGVLYWGFDARF
ncbi:hypothetical protein BJX99DRAFT_252834 [Aspergillus californicus]